MIANVGRKVGGAIVTLFLVSMITFGAINLRSPEDVARNALGRYVTEEQLQAYVKVRRLDEPVYVRYGEWLGDMVQGDWGTSPVTGRAVQGDLFERLGNTLILSAIAIALAVPISLGIGAYVALRPGSLRDLIFVIATVAIAALPEFVLGIGVLLLFGVWLELLPVDSTAFAFGDFAGKARAATLPAIALVLAIVAQESRLARATFRDALGAPYTQAAVLRGLTRRTVIWRHVLPNAAVVLVHVIALNMMWLLGGVLVIENVFAFPGVGQLLVDAVRNGDVILLQAGVVVTGAIFISISVCADVLASVLNPRLRKQS